jgi:hypothetical protein
MAIDPSISGRFAMNESAVEVTAFSNPVTCIVPMDAP